MEAVFLYFGKVIICSGVMFLYYRLSLKDKTFHHYNRFYLLSAILISLLLPLIKVDDFTIEVNSNLYEVIDRFQNFNTTKNISNDHIYLGIIYSALGLVSLCFLGKFIYGIFKIQQLKSQFRKESFDGINFYHTDLTDAPFSYFKNLFWKNTIVLNSDLGKQILKHEMVHIEQKHTFDKIFIEIITSVFWFNPFFHIIKRELNLIHEYLADKKAVKQSDTKAFAQMLLASHFSGTQLPATSPFLSSNLKKRLKMLQKPKTKFGYARRIFALPVLFSVAFAYMVDARNKEIKETNIAIQEAVAQIKKDTTKPGKLDVEPVELRLFRKSESQKKIADLGKRIEEKSKALKSLKPESEEFKKSIDEIGSLSEEIGKITNSEDFKKSVRGFVVPFGGEAMAFNLDGADMKKMNEFFNSDEWKDNVKELKKMRVEIPDMDFDFPEEPPFPPDAPDGPPSPPSPPNAPRVKVYKFKDMKDMKWSPESEVIVRAKAERAKESAGTAKKRAELDRKRAKLNEKRAKLEGERAKLEAERRALEGNDRRMFFFNNDVSYNTSPGKVMKIDTDYIKVGDKKNKIIVSGLKNAEGTGDMKIYVNGKEVTKQEMNALNPNDIKNISINKNTNNGRSSGEVRIETKK
ncbi:putative nucleic acid-binding Zn-ribbon protein [Chryseobacterium defluvii]|uniref:Putative nucleic acid-binding Zn-ribbon protein n=1 Tax=Chryseobacterium defluvii TaxID=160396 RepID=A0A840KDT9_9FLAO|nr:M56 family metallopeptidase [Chryseobacterium defluvii]MBB4805713.1 putative nucleic acid-binding Zn-ribbon protein [Chryseobacterium defluvii]